MRKFSKKYILILSILMIFTVTSIVFFAATDNSFPGVKFEFVDVQYDIYKFVFEAKTASTIMLLETTFSFDNSIIMPVRESNQEDVTITDGGSSVYPFLIIAEDVQERNPFVGMPVIWGIDGNRTAFRFGLFASPGQELHYAISDPSYIEMFEFHFRLQPGKTLENITTDTFNFESGSDINNFVEKFSPISENGIGTHLKEAIDKDYFWGAMDQGRYPDSIDEVINPFEKPGLIDPSDPTEPTEVTPSAFVEQLTGNRNNLNITVTEMFYDGTSNEITQTFSIENNSSGIFDIGLYRVFVATRGNTQIREIYIVE